MTEKDEEKGFVIKDRRIFSEESRKEEGNEASRDRVDVDQASAEEPAAPAGEREAMSTEEKESEQTSHSMPQVDFSGFIFSLYTSAAFHFGDMADPATGKKEKNISAAKQMIDIMAMLQEKTQGNLTGDEKAMIDALLYELRMRYVKES